MQGWGIVGALGTARPLDLTCQGVPENSAALQGHVSEPPTHTHTRQGPLTHCLSQNCPPLPL